MYRVSDNSRFLAALVVAVAAHAALLAGIDFRGFAPSETAPPITITLAGYPQSTPAITPDPVEPPTAQAAFHATDTKGSVATDGGCCMGGRRGLGPEAEPVPSEREVPDTAMGRSEPLPETPPPPLAVEPKSPATIPVSRPFAGKTAVDLARDIAALDRTDAAPADPTQRVRRLLAGATTTPEFAYYLEAWRRKVERIGNLNYPREARSRGLSGSLRLLVTITADGALRDVRVLETSGHSTLDEAAVHIVRLAAPYAPFSPKMRASTDLLEIERTWHFRNSRYSS